MQSYFYDERLLVHMTNDALLEQYKRQHKKAMEVILARPVKKKKKSTKKKTLPMSQDEIEVRKLIMNVAWEMKGGPCIICGKTHKRKKGNH